MKRALATIVTWVSDLTRNQKDVAIIVGFGAASCICLGVFADLWYYWLDFWESQVPFEQNFGMEG